MPGREKVSDDEWIAAKRVLVRRLLEARQDGRFEELTPRQFGAVVQTLFGLPLRRAAGNNGVMNDAPKPNPAAPCWRVLLPGGQVACEVSGHTAGEARAAAKVKLNIPRSGRLPVGTKLVRINDEVVAHESDPPPTRPETPGPS